ncbi:MAG: hypothetical protein Q9172_002767 [Xanthocarpia lactea]
MDFKRCFLILEFLVNSLPSETTRSPIHSDGTKKMALIMVRSGIFLRWKQPAAAGNDNAGEADMIIFCASYSLRQNLESLIKRHDWQQALGDPFCFFAVILDNLFKQLDEAIWNIHRVLRSVEHVGHSKLYKPGEADALQRVLEIAGKWTTGVSFDFVGMYNIAKHVIHLKESSSAAYLAACEVSEAHRHLMFLPTQVDKTRMVEGVQALIQHKLTLLEGCKLRVQSLDSRAQNMTNLAFNTVNQQDSQTMKSDSQSMKVIAVVTMMFLPAATIGSICGSHFFNFNPDNHKIMLSADFELFWAVTVPLTVFVFSVYLLWRRLKRNQARHSGRSRIAQKLQQ